MASDKVEKAKDVTITIPAGNTEAAMLQVQQEQDKALQKEEDKATDTEAARAKVLVEQSGYSLGDMAVSTDMRRETIAIAAHPNDVNFEVTNPGKTGMPKGVTVVSKETAEHFTSLGLGKIVK